MAARGLRGVRDDLSELGRHLLDIACFLSPLLPPPHHDSPPPSPRPASPPPRPSARVLAGILSDLAEIGGGFRSGLSRFSGGLRGPADRDRRSSADRAGDAMAVAGVSEEVLEFVADLIKCPESWLEFPVAVDGEFHMSRTQRDHVSAVEHCNPDLQSLRLHLCPTYMNEESFWKIYFALLHPKLNKHDSELLSTYQIVNSIRVVAKETCNRPVTQSQNFDSQSLPSLASEKCGSIQQEPNETWQDALMVKTRSQQSIDQWSVVTSAVDVSSDAMKLRPDDVSLRNTGEGNVFVMEKYMDSLLTEEEQVRLPYSHRRKHVSAGENTGYQKMSKLKMSSDEESGDWQAVEDSDYEILEKSSVDRSTESFHRHA